MRALAFVLALGIGAALPLTSNAAPAAQIYRIGVLHATSPAAFASFAEALRRGLLELGYVEGQNIMLEFRAADDRYERLAGLATELVALKVDVIFAVSGVVARAAKKAAPSIPIVFYTADDPVRAGLVSSLSHPGTNMTGLSSINVELSAKRVELLKAAAPRITRVAVLWNPTDPNGARRMKEATAAARALRIVPVPLEVREPDDLQHVLSTLRRDLAAGLVLVPDSMLFGHQKQVADLAINNRIPAIAFKEFAESGGLMGYGPDLRAVHRRAAAYIDKILKGAKPADLPVEQPTKFELAINLKTARILGLTIPQSVLLRADEVIR